MKPDKTVEVRNVNIPVTQGNLSEIASGVSPNELVVTDGQDKLQQGSHVEPHTQPVRHSERAEYQALSNAANARRRIQFQQGQKVGAARLTTAISNRGTASQ